MFFFCCLWLWSSTGVCAVEVKSVSVTEGDSVTLESALAEIQSKDMIMWRFGPQDFLLAKISRDDNKGENFGDVTDEKSRDRLKLDNQTGSLTITHSRISDSGLYTVSSRTKGDTPLHTFTLTVYAYLPAPVMIRDCSSSVQYCSVVCSAVNVSAVRLSWYKGNSVLSSISAPDLSISLSLPLEVEYQDKDTYSCVINNTISNQTTHLDINTLCQTCSVLPSAGGSLLIVSLVFWIFKKQRNTYKGVEAVQRGEEITYADPTFYKREKKKTVQSFVLGV